ncbi:adenosylcobinamide-phosphate synthase CbiB [Hoeflea sp. TYP-13]|uniref:adenosylcobinamide-phosphate synthase CbiB n=1 Tax=Hoeflea sp. TYP-13 TaxID=3230023 RepID=UPI0034C66486
MHLAILVLALLADRFIGDPDWLWEKISHPVVIFGAAISAADRIGNKETNSDSIRRRNGLISIILLLFLAVVAGVMLARLFAVLGVVGFFLEVGVVAVFLAQKSLADHVTNVASGLREGGLAGGREAVSLIVGRDPGSLDEAGICRAAIESLAENFSDGVVAPAFWYALFGLPGIFAYKMLNTADSMIAHKNSRYLHFGWAAANLDDLANWPASRLSALLIVIAATFKTGWRAATRAFNVVLRDAALHRSPNAGWPEGAMAGALGLALAGERVYGGVAVREPLLNAAGKREVNAADVEAAVGLFHGACTGLVVLFAAFFVLF